MMTVYRRRLTSSFYALNEASNGGSISLHGHQETDMNPGGLGRR